jgi:hypothetical protein
MLMRRVYLANTEWTPLTILASSFHNEIYTERDTQSMSLLHRLTELKQLDTFLLPTADIQVFIVMKLNGSLSPLDSIPKK